MVDPEDLATGGRVGLKDGMSRRKSYANSWEVQLAGIGALKAGCIKNVW